MNLLRIKETKALVMDVTGELMWWHSKWYNVVFNHANWTPEVHSWFQRHCGKFRYVPLSGGSDCVYMFADEAGADFD